MKYIHIILTNWPNDNIVPFNLFAVMMLLFAIFPRVQQFFTWNAQRIDRLFRRTAFVRFVCSFVCLPRNSRIINYCNQIVLSSNYVPDAHFLFPSFHLLSFTFHLLCIAIAIAMPCFALRVIHFVCVLFFFLFSFRCRRCFFFWSIAQFISKIKNDGAVL